MQEWTKLPVIKLKKVLRSRAGRIAELQAEVQVLNILIVNKTNEGDLGTPVPKKPKVETPETPKETEENPKENPNLGELNI